MDLKALITLLTALNEVEEKEPPAPAKPVEDNWPIGKPFMIRTVTHIVTGRLVRVTYKEFILTHAAWIADTGRYMDAVLRGEFAEVEPYPDARFVFVGRGALIDAVEIPQLPRDQK